MQNSYQIIDPKTWKRALHCQIFRNSTEPQFCVTFELDITNFLSKIREKGYSFTMALIYAVTKCANGIEEFRYRFVDGQVVLFDKIDTAFTYLNQETELFKVVQVEMKGSMEEYNRAALETAASQEEYFTGPLGNDVFQFHLFPGFLIPTYPILFPGRKMLLLCCLTGGSILNGIKRNFCLFPFRCIILLWMEYTLANWQRLYSSIWMNSSECSA